ncbi:MAG: M24 family metallopeptidase [Verrucomicrobia bacterium]|nr:M24 family metallopeptidase [Verrucomicrobiota bacterium]
MKKPSQPAKLMISASTSDADMYYATRIFVPDPFIFIEKNGDKHVVMSDLEIDRTRRCLKDFHIWSLTELKHKMPTEWLSLGLSGAAAHLLRKLKIRSVQVPGTFPFLQATQLQTLGIKLTPTNGSLYPERDFKSQAEIRFIQQALKVTESGIQAGLNALKRAHIGSTKRLMLDGNPLTAERLRAIIDGMILHSGGIAQDTIVACGKQGCDPHERGHGPLKAHQPIIIDVFPRITESGYHGDITRTFVKGQPESMVQEMYDAVKVAQEAAIQSIRHGVSTKVPHEAVCNVFQKRGFITSKHPKSGQHQGFFHGTGHGLGLEVHEMPRMGSTSSGTLLEKHVVTVEPGLYYPGIGGVRLEDVVVVTQNGTRNLVQFPKSLVV